MSDQENLNHRVTVLETSIPLFLESLNKEVVGLRADFKIMTEKMVETSNNRVRIDDLQKELQAHNERNEEFHREVTKSIRRFEKIVYGGSGVLFIVGVFWSVFTFIVPFFIH